MDDPRGNGGSGLGVRGLVVLALAGCAPAAAPPAELPERVVFREADRSFNAWWYFALHDGAIWAKPNEETGLRRARPWRMLGESGLPDGRGVAGAPEDLVAVSADGAHLQVVDAAGRLYRATDARGDIAGDPHWKDAWGWPAARGPGLTMDLSGTLAWSVSDSHPFQVRRYEDIFGESHPVGLGVAHVYRLLGDGREIAYNDWWLPADWSRRICGPERGTVRGVNLSASASTLMLLTREGQVWTRLYDFDTSGENDTLRYTYLEEAVRRGVRGLPAEPWHLQPSLPPSRLGQAIAIAQDGRGNAARELRVQAELDGAPGYWTRPIFDPEWAWVPDPAAAPRAFLDELPEAEPTPPPDDRALVGTLSREGSEEVLELQIDDFNLLCSPATVRVGRPGRGFEAGGAPVTWVLHHLDPLAREVRADDRLAEGSPGTIRAALLIPPSAGALDDVEDAAWLAAWLGEREVIHLSGEAGADALSLVEIGRDVGGLVPRREKGNPGQLFHLSAGSP